ncbi:hypothetical protein [Rhizobium leguminosarum]|uniref:hypothetical protein n=1 Tax=Rhizobium leguminosarum TaxID=384 RepID=UPI0013DB05AD|nr:hypothetical protein [Rhizobium leguminosarum]NEK36296.1 hypothetical protein [Rhizobium leguminosarum]
MDVTGTLTAIGTALSVVKQLTEIDAHFDKADLKLKVAEITSALAQAKLGLVDAEEVIRAKDSEIKKLWDQLKYKAENTTRLDSMLYDTEDGQPVGRPYCPVCEEKGSLIKIIQDLVGPGRLFNCPKCKSNFGHVSVWQSKNGNY